MLRLDWNMVITIVNLIVLCLLLKKFLIGPVTAIMEQRAALIEQQLADAKNDKQAAGDLKASYEEKLKTSDAESIRIVEESRASARAGSPFQRPSSRALSRSCHQVRITLSSAARSRAGLSGHMDFFKKGLAWHRPRQGEKCSSVGETSRARKVKS